MTFLSFTQALAGVVEAARAHVNCLRQEHCRLEAGRIQAQEDLESVRAAIKVAEVHLPGVLNHLQSRVSPAYFTFGGAGSMLKHSARELERQEARLTLLEQRLEESRAWEKTWIQDGGYQFLTVDVPNTYRWRHTCGYRTEPLVQAWPPERCAGCGASVGPVRELLGKPAPRVLIEDDFARAHKALSMGCSVPKGELCVLCGAPGEHDHVINNEIVPDPPHMYMGIDWSKVPSQCWHSSVDTHTGRISFTGPALQNVPLPGAERVLEVLRKHDIPAHVMGGEAPHALGACHTIVMHILRNCLAGQKWRLSTRGNALKIHFGMRATDVPPNVSACIIDLCYLYGFAFDASYI